MLQYKHFMRGLEEGRTTPHIVQLTKEIVGVGAFERYKKYRSKDLQSKDAKGTALMFGFMQFVMPLAWQEAETREYKESPFKIVRSEFKNTTFVLMDLGVSLLSFSLVMTFPGTGIGIGTKIGYNFIAQIAPDVATLIKRRISSKV